MVIGIIGGGASGMAAALFASQNPDAQVILMERQARLGRKLAATGNGRCNLTNLSITPESYHGDQPEFIHTALEGFGAEDTIAWFHDMGLFTMVENNSRVYPFSEQASSVVDILRFALDKPNITLKLGFEVEKVKKTSSGFWVESREETLECDKLIIACGGLAGSKLGGTMSGYKLLRAFGHKSTRLRPALVQLKTGWKGIGGLKGVRANCHASIYCNGELHRESEGEIQFTEYGISGPVIFEISRDACQGGGEWTCRMNFLPHRGADLREALARRKATNLPASELLTGIVHNRLGRVLTQSVGISAQRAIAELSDYELDMVCQAVQNFEISLTEAMGMDSAQVTAGGILTKEFYDCSMESRLVPGLYACGEVLDIDGDCGGYNLQWAWSSGRLAGLHAGGMV